MMKQNLLFMPILAFLLAACSSRTDYNKLLVQADSLMQSRPDSAISILETIPTNQLKSKADSAYYALLLTQARDKNFIWQTDDSLIQSAVHYYDSIKDNRMQALAYYHWGSVHRDRNEQAIAIKKYLQAIPYAQKAKDKRLLGRIYNNTGYLYYLQDFYEKADSTYRLTEQIGEQMRDTSLWAEAISMQGKVHIYQKKYRQAEEKLLKALEILGDYKQDGVRADIAAALSTLYSRMSDREKALRFAKQNLMLQKDTLHCYRVFLELGEAYFQNGQYDSATIYFKKSLSTSRYGTKSGAYMRLAKIAEKQGDTTLALELERQSSIYQDSLNSSSQSTNLIEAEQQIKLQQKDELYEKSSVKKNYYILILTAIAIISIGLSYKIYRKKFRQQKLEQLLAENKLRQQYAILQQQLSQKGKKIAALDSLDVYAKMERIIADYKKSEKSDERMKQQDWQLLIAETDYRMNNITLRLQSEFHLSDDEIRLCCLSLTSLSTSHFGYLLHCTRDTIYKKADRILEQKMGFCHKETTLPEVLKKIAKGEF